MIPNVGGEVAQVEFSYILLGNVKGYNYFIKKSQQFAIRLNIYLSYDPVILQDLS